MPLLSVLSGTNSATYRVSLGQAHGGQQSNNSSYLPNTSPKWQERQHTLGCKCMKWTNRSKEAEVTMGFCNLQRRHGGALTRALKRQGSLEHRHHSLGALWGWQRRAVSRDGRVTLQNQLLTSTLLPSHDQGSHNLSCQPTQRQPGHVGTWANSKCNRNDNVLPASSFIYKYWNDKLSALPDACKEKSLRSKSSSNGTFYLATWKEGSITSQ